MENVADISFEDSNLEADISRHLATKKVGRIAFGFLASSVLAVSMLYSAAFERVFDKKKENAVPSEKEIVANDTQANEPMSQEAINSWSCLALLSLTGAAITLVVPKAAYYRDVSRKDLCEKYAMTKQEFNNAVDTYKEKQKAEPV